MDVVTKDLAGAAVLLVDGRTGKRDQRSVGQSSTHPRGQRAVLCAVRLIDHDEDILSLGDDRSSLWHCRVELVNRSQNGSACATRKKLAQVLPTLGLDWVGEAGALKLARNLAV